MKHLRKFDSVSAMTAAITASEITIVGMALDNNVPVAGRKSVVTPPVPVVDPTIPFYIEDISGSENTVQINKDNDKAPTLTIEKSTDGETWETMGSTSTSSITATIPANGKLYLRCSTNAWGNNISGAFYYNTIRPNGNCNVGGNIMSLLYGSSFTGNETTFPSGSTYNFYNLFYSRGHLVDVSDLLLPATTLTEYCYSGMFSGASLTTAPELHATTLAQGCYSNMFRGCTSLTTAPAALPATTLVSRCYYSMFYGCTALTTAPELPATTLAELCYYYMFRDCTNLNYIKCLATDKSATNCTNNWVRNVASTGTFVKDPNISESTWGTGNNGIPSGWTVEDATE